MLLAIGLAGCATSPAPVVVNEKKPAACGEPVDPGTISPRDDIYVVAGRWGAALRIANERLVSCYAEDREHGKAGRK